jgi:hypothetical protein
MNTRGYPRGPVCRISVVLLALSVAGCPKKDQEPEEKEPEASAAIVKSDPQPEPEAEPADEPDAEGGETPGEDEAAAAADELDATGEPEAADEGEDAATGDAVEDEPEGPDPKALLKTVVNKRTKDDEARALLAQAEEAGASEREVAKAAVDRGLALHATPERAKAFFEWAAEKDSKYPDPVWHLARQAAVEGDVDQAKELLGAVKQRGGKKLLQQIDFDPMWEILKDDPDVRKLL